MLADATGFLQTSNSIWKGKTDQAFLSRQQLLEYRRASKFSQDSLQYLTTFSRSLEQPSYVPKPNRPKIVSPAPKVTELNADFRGGNSGFEGDDEINPSFLTIRVKNTFTRLDGSTAAVGEPLVKTRWNLDRLSLVTRTATSTATPTSDIYKRFGLSRSDATQPWTYNHGILNGGEPIVGTLARVADENREPDFAEMLKAAIAAGSLGKAAPNGEIPGAYHYVLDASVDLQVLQIMANLIDQYDEDAYPTRIAFGPPGSVRTVFGTEDLPYFLPLPPLRPRHQKS